MSFLSSRQKDAYGEALRELSEFGESPEALAGPPLPAGGEREGPARPEGFYGERNWEWEGVQRGPFSGRGPKDWRRSDDRVSEEVSDALCVDGDLDASDVSVDVKDGEVVLEGTVVDRAAKRRAEDLAERCGGVRDVHNRLRIAR